MRARRGAQLTNTPPPACVKLYAPDLHEYLSDILHRLLGHEKFNKLEENFPGSAFPMVTFNLGPCTITLPHRDGANLAGGWCTITALGSFDCEKGGRLVLWELGLAVRFPAGSTVAIPSAIVTHSNTSIQAGETRMSMTQYFSGHLCRYVENDFRPDSEVQQDPAEWQRVLGSRRSWKEWLAKFSKVGDFLDRPARVP